MLSAPSSLPVMVLVSSADGTATGGSDYECSPARSRSAPETTQTILFPIGHDLLDEDDETFFVNLSEPTNATVGDAQGVGTIVDNDPVPSIQILGDRIFAEAQASVTPMIFAVRLSAPSGRAVTVHYSTADGTATAGSDEHISTSGMLTLLPGRRN